jgi:hypothetical protein
MTQSHLSLRNDVRTGCIGATLSIVKFLTTPLTPRHRARARFLIVSGFQGRGGWRSVIRSRICRRFWPLWDRGTVRVNSLNGTMAGPRITPGDQGTANRPCLSSDARGEGLGQTKRRKARASSHSGPGYDFSTVML